MHEFFEFLLTYDKRSSTHKKALTESFGTAKCVALWPGGQRRLAGTFTKCEPTPQNVLFCPWLDLQPQGHPPKATRDRVGLRIDISIY